MYHISDYECAYKRIFCLEDLHTAVIFLLPLLMHRKKRNLQVIAFQILEFDFTFKYPDMRYK
ncbi:hypothetical protein T4B_1951 [Trichinella pseudospiralis]|uniref:Uncharacterized protein n=1 Tax=Trichinella pseudospiralis TaxID=6337 RepID=A0A0V1IJX0_TRIPS|nr:hypothetical protein T4B_1951 [Trichinella pseudospiralis]